MDDKIEVALKKAYMLGQTYWQQADSESYAQNRKSDETQARFDALVSETVDLLREAAQPADEELRRDADPVFSVAERVMAGPGHQSDTELLDFLRDECNDLRCIAEPTGGDDHDVRWLVISHHMAKPHERIIGRSFSEEPRDAIRAAIEAEKREEE